MIFLSLAAESNPDKVSIFRMNIPDQAERDLFSLFLMQSPDACEFGMGRVDPRTFNTIGDLWLRST